MYLADQQITDISNLRHLIWGEVTTPYDDAYDDARAVFNLSLDQRPAAIVHAESAGDVQATVRFARKNNLRIAPQTTGHNAGPLEGTLDASVILRTTRMKGIEIDEQARIARVQAGTLWGEVADRLEGTGLAALHGSSRTVGVVGYSLTGGVGWQARKHGLQTDQITAVELVDARGELVRASADENSELFWALRGGGGNFGVVTAIEFALVATPQVNAGWLAWPWEHTDEVLQTWLTMLDELPDEITSAVRVIQFPPFEEVPEALRGRQMVVFDAAILGDRDLTNKLLAPLRALGPELDTFDEVDASALSYLHQDPEEGAPYSADHMLLDELTVEDAKKLVAAAGPQSGSPLAVVELRHMGGALERIKPGHGARANLPAKLMYFAVGIHAPGLPIEAIEGQMAQLRTAVEPGRSERDYLNFTERAGSLSDFFDERTSQRLAAVKREHDAGNLMQANFGV